MNIRTMSISAKLYDGRKRIKGVTDMVKRGEGHIIPKADQKQDPSLNIPNKVKRGILR